MSPSVGTNFPEQCSATYGHPSASDGNLLVHHIVWSIFLYDGRPGRAVSCSSDRKQPDKLGHRLQTGRMMFLLTIVSKKIYSGGMMLHRT